MALNIGDPIPKFSKHDPMGVLFDSTRLKSATVIYFYPKDFTAGCTKEACAFREAYREFQKWGAEVIGVSADKTKTHHKFRERYRLPFLLLSDEKQRLRRKFGVKKHVFGLIPGRDTFVFDKNGILQFHCHQLKADNHVEKALSVVKKLYDET